MRFHLGMALVAGCLAAPLAAQNSCPNTSDKEVELAGYVVSGMVVVNKDLSLRSGQLSTVSLSALRPVTDAAECTAVLAAFSAYAGAEMGASWKPSAVVRYGEAGYFLLFSRNTGTGLMPLQAAVLSATFTVLQAGALS